MSNIETRLRETLDRVAATTKVNRKVDEIVQVRSRRPLPRFTVGVAAFALVAAVFAVPILLGDSPTNNVAGDLSAPTDVGGNSSAPVDGPVTIDPAWLTVDPDDLAAFNEIPLPGNGERSPLNSETIWCFYEEARPVETAVRNVAVDEPVTADDLTTTCATETDSAKELESPPQELTICRGVLDDTAYQAWASSDEYTIVSGDIASSKPGFPVILGWQSDCTSEALETTPDAVTLTPDLSIDAINHARQLELAVVGAAIRNCLSHDQSEALTAAVVTELGQDWMHIALSSPSTVGACYQPFIVQQWGWVLNELVRGEQASRTGTTLAPSSP